MQQLWFLAVVLICPLVMGGMMVWMMCDMRAGHGQRAAAREEPAE